MKLLTIDEIIEQLNKEGLPITKAKFNYYSKIGFFFAPEKKTKKRVKEGIISLYAEELLDIIRTFYAFKDDWNSLDEIKNFMLKNDKEKLTEIYKEAGAEEGTIICIDLSYDLTEKVLQWRKDGYYKGLLNIYRDIINKLKIDRDAIDSQIAVAMAIGDRIHSEMKCSEDQETVKKIQREEEDRLRGYIYETIDNLKKTTNEKYEPLHEFLIENEII